MSEESGRVGEALVPDATLLLADAMEMLVFAVRHVVGGRVVLITEWPHPTSPGRRAFVRFEFVGVHEFSRLPGDRPALEKHHHSYELRTPEQRAFVIEGLRHSDGGVEIWLGPEFGGFAFRYATVSAIVLQTVGTEGPVGTWTYKNLGGETLDFYDLFRDRSPIDEEHV